jgi:outer membrane protein OmpA-like peptidoglycan-associated protein
MPNQTQPPDGDFVTPPAAQSRGVNEPITRPMEPMMVILVAVVLLMLGVLILFASKGLFDGKSSSSVNSLSELRSEVSAKQSDINRQRLAMGKSANFFGTESAEEIAKRLKGDADTLISLSMTYQQMLSEKETDISAKNAENLRLNQLNQTFVAENARLQGDLQRSLVAASETDMLRRDLANLKLQRDALTAELNNLRKNGASNEELAALQRRYDETLRAKEFFEARVKELEGEQSKGKLFASSENELLPAAVELFRNLRELEGRPDSELTTSYSGLGVKLGANVLQTLTYTSGSSGLAPADEQAIAKIAEEMPEGDLLLVIGYASETGNVENNRKLSSDRATGVAEFYSTLKRQGQLVQAVYLGQTSRFSSRIPERNQLCEIWHIRKK